MRPVVTTPAHTSEWLGELVCSNSLRSDALDSAVGLLKEEMRQLSSLLMSVAEESRVPAGKALAVDRELFARRITERLAQHPNISIIREEVERLPPVSPDRGPTIVATGPLSSAQIAQSLRELTGHGQLAFYDAISPIIYAETIDRAIVYEASRYIEGPGDYLNCPLDRETYAAFIAAVAAAEKVALKEFEKEAKYFEGCLPIEVMVARGGETLRFGPMKPVGLPDPRTGKEAHAVVQLRKENREGTLYNMVGFQTKLTYPEQKRIFRMIPGLGQAEFARLGSVHRNTFVCAPVVLEPTLQVKQRPDILLAGQLTGVEGYVESTAMGLLAGLNGARMMQRRQPVTPPPATAMGALVAHLTRSSPSHFQPSNINFGLFPPLGAKIPKKLRGEQYAQRALSALAQWAQEEGVST